MIKKLIISYSDDDRDVAHVVRQALLDADYEIWIAREDLKGSVMWTQDILDAIDNTDGIVLLWSSNAKESRDVYEEIRIARVFLKPIFPVLAHPMDKIPSLPDEIRALQVIHEGDFDLSIAELKARLSDPIRSNIKYPELAKNGSIPKPPNPYFVGRNSELKDLFVDTLGFHGESKKGIPIAVSGLAGIGKTHLALTFAYRFNLFFSDGVYWVDTPNGIVQEFEKIGNNLGVKRLKEERPLDYATRVYDRLGQLEKGLVIFDNVTDIPEFRKWCPVGSTSCSVILTTRKSPRGFAVRVMNLTELDAESAYKLITSRRKDADRIRADKEEQQALQEICATMGNHPLALELCASYLQSEPLKPSEFLKKLKKGAFNYDGIQEHFGIFADENHNILLDVMKLSYNNLDRKRTDRYFFLMSWFTGGGIQAELIANAFGSKEEGYHILNELENISLVYYDTYGLISLHPLVVQFARALQSSDHRIWQREFIRVVTEYAQQRTGSSTFVLNEQVEAHLVQAAELMIAFPNELLLDVKSSHALTKILAKRANLNSKSGRRDNAIRILRVVYELSTILKDKDLQRRAAVRMGGLYFVEKNYDEALSSYERALALGPKLISAIIYRSKALTELGRLDEAEKEITIALNLEPSNAVALRVRGTIRRLRRRYSEALSDFREIPKVSIGVEWIISWLEAILSTSRATRLTAQKRLVESVVQKISTNNRRKCLEGIESETIDCFLIDTENTMLESGIPPYVPFFFLNSPQITSDTDFDFVKVISALHFYTTKLCKVAVVVLFQDSALSEEFKNIIQKKFNKVAFDTLLFDFSFAEELFNHKKASAFFRKSILSEIDLQTVSAFVTAGPTPENIFVGREKEIREIVEKCEQSSFVVIGGRRIGKTSLLSILHNNRFPAIGVTPVYLDCGNIVDYNSFLDSPVNSLKLIRSDKLSTIGTLLSQDLKNMRCVFLLDEADKMVSKDKAENWMILNRLRSLSSSGLAQSILCGEHRLRESFSDSTSPMFNFANKILLGPLDSDSVEELVTAPFRRLGVEFREEKSLLEKIYAITSGHPNIVQRLCHRLLGVLSKSKKRIISNSDLDRVLQDPIFLREDFLETIWEGADALEKVVSLLMATNRTLKTSDSIRTILRDRFKIELQASELEKALSRLVELRSILRHTPPNAYRFFNDNFPKIILTLPFQEILKVSLEDYGRTQH